MIRVVLPAHLRTLARVDGEVTVHVEREVTQRAVLDALEATYPVLRGTIRDHVTHQRRSFVRSFACEQDFPTILRTRRFPTRWRPGKSLSWSSGRWLADRSHG